MPPFPKIDERNLPSPPNFDINIPGSFPSALSPALAKFKAVFKAPNAFNSLGRTVPARAPRSPNRPPPSFFSSLFFFASSLPSRRSSTIVSTFFEMACLSFVSCCFLSNSAPDSIAGLSDAFGAIPMLAGAETSGFICMIDTEFPCLESSSAPSSPTICRPSSMFLFPTACDEISPLETCVVLIVSFDDVFLSPTNSSDLLNSISSASVIAPTPLAEDVYF